MGLSYLTRYNLFMESGDSIESDDGIVHMLPLTGRDRQILQKAIFIILTC